MNDLATLANIAEILGVPKGTVKSRMHNALNKLATLVDGETLKWSFDEGALSGMATVHGDTVTVERIPLTSGVPYKNLRIYR